MTTLNLLGNVRPQFFTSAGVEASGYKLNSYAAGTTTPKATYADNAGVTPNPNPIILNARGEPDNSGTPISIFLNGVYKFVLTDASGATIWTVDNVSGTDGSIDTTLRTDLAASSGANLIGFIQSGAGAVAETLQTKFRRTEVSVEEYGDTSTASGTLTAFNNAFATGKVVRFEAASYTLSGPIVLTTGMKGHGAGLSKTTLTFQNTSGFTFNSASANDGYLALEGFTVSTTNTNATNTTKGMDLTNVNYSLFRDIAVQYHQKGWYLARGSAGAKGCFFNKIEDTFAYYNQYGYEINDAVSDASVTANIIINPHVEGNNIWPAQIGYAIAGYANKIYNPYASGLANNAQAVTSITSSGTTATVTQTAHGYNNNDYITIYGANQTGYNGIIPVTVTGANTYTYTVVSGLASPATGTIKAASLSQISAFMLFTQGSPSAGTQSRIAEMIISGAYIESQPLWGFCVPNTTGQRYGNVIISPHFDGACIVGNFNDPLGELAVIGGGFNQLTQTTTIKNGNLQVNSTQNGFTNREGNNATQGVATLGNGNGTAVVSTVAVAANSRILLSVQSLGTVTAPKAIAVTARSAGVSFTITSADATDTSTVAWEIFAPAV